MTEKQKTLNNLRLGYCLLVMIICIISGGYFLSGSKAQNNQNAAISEKPTADDSDKKFEKLIGIAREKGSVRVIIGLRMEFTPIGDLTPSQREVQETNIKQKQDNFLESLAGFAIREVKQFRYMPFLGAEVDEATLEKMRQDPQVISIQEDGLVYPTLAESVPLIGAPAAWNAGFSGSGWAVAVLDSGVDKFHTFLSGKVISEACYSSNDVANGISSVCPGGVNQTTAVGSGVNCNTAVNGCRHGTHVAGIAAGNGTSFSGVARNANIVAIQVFSRRENCSPNPSPCITGFNTDIMRGLEQTLTLRNSGTNIASANMSLGSGGFTTNCDTANIGMKAAIDNLRSAGVATVVASGNDSFINGISFPACISTAVSVGNSGDGSTCLSGLECPVGNVAALNQVMSDSNSSTLLNLLAPGRWITSSVPGNAYYTWNGTSMATPHVAGAWAVLKQKKPTASVTEILNAFTSTGLPVTDTRNGITKPRIRVDAALASLSVGCNSTPIAFGQTVNGTLTNADCILSGTTRYVDVYTFSGTAGQQIAVTMNSTAFDTYLYLVNSSNQILAENDDGGGGTNSRIPANSGFFTLPATGTYSIWASSFLNSATGAYSLNLTTTAPPNACDQVTPISLNQSINGTFASSDCLIADKYTDKYSFSGSAGQQIVITQNSGAVDSYLRLYNSSGQLIAFDDDGGGGLNSRIPTGSGSFPLPATGNYTIEASTFIALQTGAYTVSLLPGGVAPTTRKQFDFDGDNKTDVAIFRPSNGQWWVNRSSNGSAFATTFGVSTDRIAPLDYTGDSQTDIAFWRPSNGQWNVLRSNVFTFYAYAYGANGDIPASGFFDSDNQADTAVFRPSTATWYIRRSTDGGSTIVQFGANGDVPVVADYDGDGRDDMAIYRPSSGQWWINRSSLGVIAYQFGTSTDKPVTGDFTGDSKADAAFWRPSTGEWYVLRSENSTYFAAPFGINGDIPLAGDWDGDGLNDFAVFRPSTNVWYIRRTTAGFTSMTFGASGDKPVPSAFVP